MIPRRAFIGLVLSAAAAPSAIAREGVEDPAVGTLSGTLKKIKHTGIITLGYRES